MKLLFIFFIYFCCIALNNSFILITRRSLIANSAVKYLSLMNDKNALIIGCDKIGVEFGKELHKINYNYNTIATTTKPKNYDKLKRIVNDVVIIPQMEIGKDEVFKSAVDKSDVIIIADIISIFSIHTFMRTCNRIVKALENKQTPTMVCLVSSVNVYGSHTDGAYVDETSLIVEQDFYKNNKKENWKINHFNNAKAIRLGENSLLELAKINNNIKPVILRTSGIWNDDIMKSSINFLSNRTYIKKIGNSYMSLSYTNEIARAGLWIMDNYNNSDNNIYNIASSSFKRQIFYDNLLKKANKPLINWINDDFYNDEYNDNYYSLDINPLLPNAQRYNMRIDCSKLLRTRFKFKV